MTLEAFFEESRPELESALNRAEQELAELRARSLELESLIARARAILGGGDAVASDQTLHRAMEAVLLDGRNRWMTASEIARSIGERELYRMRDGRLVEASQVYARARNYDTLFESSQRRIRLRYLFETGPAPATGAYAAAQTRVIRADEPGTAMLIEARVAYSVRPPDGHTLAGFALVQADTLARRIVARGGFEPDVVRCFLLSNHGIEAVDGGPLPGMIQ